MYLKIFNEESTINPKSDNFQKDYKTMETMVNIIPQYIFNNCDCNPNSISKIVWLFFNDQHGWIRDNVYLKSNDPSVTPIKSPDNQNYPNYCMFMQNLDDQDFKIINNCQLTLTDIHKKESKTGLFLATIIIDLNTSQFEYNIDYDVTNNYIYTPENFRKWASKYLI